MTARRFLPASLVLAILCLGPLGSAQEPPTFSSESELVVLHVSVKNKKGSYVTDVPQEAFGVFENGEPQSIRFFTTEDTPVTVGLIVDSSGSMQPKRDVVIAAAMGFAQSSNPEDEMFGVAFNEYLVPALPPHRPFTSDVAVLRSGLAQSITARGRTGLYDAISFGLDYLQRGHCERKVLVVVSDGADNASTATFPEVLTRAQSSNAVIYAVGLFEPDDREARPKVLKELAKVSGGEAFMPRGTRDVVGVLEHIARDIRNIYTIGYVPTNTARDATYRRLRIVAESPRHGRLVVRARAGYVSGGPRKWSSTHVQ